MKRYILLLCIFACMSGIMQAADDGRVTPPPVAHGAVAPPISPLHVRFRTILSMPIGQQQRNALLELRRRTQDAIARLEIDDRERIPFMDLIDLRIDPHLHREYHGDVQQQGEQAFVHIDGGDDPEQVNTVGPSRYPMGEARGVTRYPQGPGATRRLLFE